MTWRISVAHSTTYLYESEVLASFNELRMTPMSNEHQLLVRHRTRVNPSAPMFTYRDYWGTTVEAFDLHVPHLSLEVLADSIVESTDRRLRRESDESVAWSTVDSSRLQDEFMEFLAPTSLANGLVGSAEVVAQLRSEATPRDAAVACLGLVAERMSYVPGATHVFTPASEAWTDGRGVCQDFSHISLSLLREAGIPARYVSGYHYAGSGEIGDKVTGESHAWIEAWVGFWMALDPTSGTEVAERHVVLAHGRDYHDVSPMKGIFSGGQSKDVKVSVTLVRLPR
jgi:transglutaminase-like putative cysteine protease